MLDAEEEAMLNLENEIADLDQEILDLEEEDKDEEMDEGTDLHANWQPEVAKEAAKLEAERLVFRDETTVDAPRDERQSRAKGNDTDDAADAISFTERIIVKEQKHSEDASANKTESEIERSSAEDVAVAAEKYYNATYPNSFPETTTTNTTISIADHIPAAMADGANLNPEELGLLFGQAGVVSKPSIF